MSAPVRAAMSEVLWLDPATVDPDPRGRIGLFFPAKAAALAALIAEHGQNDPVKVVKVRGHKQWQWRIIAGRHRLEAVKMIDGCELAALEVSGDPARLEEIQASENMDRRELEPLERAMFVRAVADAARLRVMKAHGVDSPQALGAAATNARLKLSRADKVQFSEFEKADEYAEAARANLAHAYSWRDETAGALGLSLSDLKRSLRIHRCICEAFPELLNDLKDRPVAKVADNLLKISALKDEAVRRRVVEMVIQYPGINLDAAMRAAGAAPQAAAPDDFTKYSSQSLGGWGRMGTADKRRFIPEFCRAIPAGMRALFRAELDRLDAEATAEKEI